MKPSITGKIYFGFAAAIILVILVGILSYNAFQKQTRQSEDVTHTYTVLNKVEELNTLLIDMETGRRGFRATGERKFLEPYYRASEKIEPTMQDIRRLVQVDTIKGKVNFLQTQLDSLISYWQLLEKNSIPGVIDRTKAIEITSREKVLMDHVREDMHAVRVAEESLLEKRKSAIASWVRIAKWLVIGGTLLILFIVIGLINFILVEFKRRLAVQKELRSMNAELREKTNSLENARRALEIKAEEVGEASRYKSQFLANMSHELRTPLNSILILSRLISENKSNNLTEKQVEYANIIQKSGMDLLNLINDILDLSKIEAGKFDMNFDKVDVVHVVNGIQKTFGVVAEEKSILFHVVQDTEFPKSIHTDRLRLEQVLRNLLSNAFKFTSQGGKVDLILNSQPETTVITNPSLSSARLIGISVKDDGIGIPEEKQALIFEAFQQAEGSTTRKFGGTGLGLSISRELIQKLGGEISVKSEPGKGSCFTVYLPVDPKEISLGSTEPAADVITPQAANEWIPKPTVTVSAEGLENKKVLVADDDMRNVFAMSTLLEELGMEVTTASTGAEAIEEIRSGNFDIVLMDIMMPEMDGYEATRRIRKDPSFAHLPVIAVTAKAGLDEKEKCISAGASDYLTKPVDNAALVAMMQKWISKKENGN